MASKQKNYFKTANDFYKKNLEDISSDNPHYETLTERWSELHDQGMIDELTALDKQYCKETGKPLGSIPRDYYRKHTKTDLKDRAHFGSFGDFKKKVIQEKKITRDNFDKKSNFSKDSKNGTIIVTAAIAGQSVHKPFWNSILSLKKARNAKLVVLPMRGVINKDEEFTPDIELYQEYIASEVIFNSNLKAIDMKENPQQMIPLTGLSRLGGKKFKDDGYSLIIAAAKQQLVSIATTTYPRIQTSTGAMTKPESYRPVRQGMFGLLEHCIGGIIVEIVDNKIFHLRHIQADADGGFYDLNHYYTSEGEFPAEAEAIYAGDFHAGWTDPTAISALHEQIKLLKPKQVFVGDVMDGGSISHHVAKNIWQEVHFKPIHMKTLQIEMENLAKEIKPFTEYPNTKLMAVKGNHDEWISRYLGDKGRAAMHDILNVEMPGAFLFYKFMEEKMDPLIAWMDRFHPELNKKITWLKRQDSIRVAGIECAKHGDVAPGGAKGSPRGFESMGDICIGHVHKPYIFRNVWAAGTLSVFDMPYTANEPASAWLHANIAIYKSGMRQMHISVKGKWKL